MRFLVLAAAALQLCCSLPASAQQAVQGRGLGLETASQLVSAAAQFAGQKKTPVSIVVVDAAGHFVTGVRMDGAPFATFDVARGKALATAATGGASGAELAQRYRANPIVFGQMSSLVYGGPLFPSQGSLGIYIGGKLAGAVGVSGGPSEMDEEAGRRGIAAIGATETP
ncbi:hypothetical protein BJN34_29165 [Cupriavidus necator]|uniref:Heme-binding protein n=1 Tax=Cupriavidus necator TaxID=106590 RepID=A0A1U9UZD5_CUPNE|nr:heme-binding protein [Cupriavidus necator]AQV97939.1 hypothetical protein BJN34_29165 [Cupriavidus necator]